MLHKLQWELTAVTPLDYLDQAIPRLALPAHLFSQADLAELRRRTETILVICATDYHFSYVSQSSLAAAAIGIAFTSLSQNGGAGANLLKEIKLALQTVTHTATVGDN